MSTVVSRASAVGHEHDRERRRRSRQRRRPPAERDEERAVADQGHRARRPEQPEVAATEGVQRPCARRAGRSCVHGPRLSSAARGASAGSSPRRRLHARPPGPELGPEAYRALGRDARPALDTERYADARGRPRRRPRARIPSSTTTRRSGCASRRTSSGAWAARGPRSRTSRARSWAAGSTPRHFELYDDVCPCSPSSATLGLKLGLALEHEPRPRRVRPPLRAIEVDAWLSSGSHGKVKPSPLIFAAALELLGVLAAEAVMVGDSPEDDIRGARACGMRAILVDRAGELPDEPERIRSLSELPALLR